RACAPRAIRAERVGSSFRQRSKTKAGAAESSPRTNSLGNVIPGTKGRIIATRSRPANPCGGCSVDCHPARTAHGEPDEPSGVRRAEEQGFRDTVTRLADEDDEEDERCNGVRYGGRYGGPAYAEAGDQHPVEAEVDRQCGKRRDDVDLLTIAAREVARE